LKLWYCGCALPLELLEFGGGLCFSVAAAFSRRAATITVHLLYHTNQEHNHQSYCHKAIFTVGCQRTDLDPCANLGLPSLGRPGPLASAGGVVSSAAGLGLLARRGLVVVVLTLAPLPNTCTQAAGATAAAAARQRIHLAILKTEGTIG
jgi:hypothetical protein